MFPVEPYDASPKKILPSTIENPQSKLYAHSKLFYAWNALKLWTFWRDNPDEHRIVAYSKTTFNNLCKNADKNDNKVFLFDQLKAPVVDISVDKGRGKAAFRILVETPPALMEWLRTSAALKRLEAEQKSNHRVGQLIIKLYDYDTRGQIESPRQFVCLTDYLMAILIMQHLSPIVSIYRDIQLELRLPKTDLLLAKVEAISLRQFIPEEIEWGVPQFMSHYAEVVLQLFKNEHLTFELNPEDVQPDDKVITVEKAPLEDEYVLVRDQRYYRKVSGIKILKSDFRLYPFDSIVRKEMESRLDKRLQHCAKKTAAETSGAIIPTDPMEVDDFQTLPDLSTLGRQMIQYIPAIPSMNVEMMNDDPNVFQSGNSSVSSGPSVPSVQSAISASIQAVQAVPKRRARTRGGKSRSSGRGSVVVSGVGRKRKSVSAPIVPPTLLMPPMPPIPGLPTGLLQPPQPKRQKVIPTTTGGISQEVIKQAMAAAMAAATTPEVKSPEVKSPEVKSTERTEATERRAEAAERKSEAAQGTEGLSPIPEDDSFMDRIGALIHDDDPVDPNVTFWVS